MIPWKDWKLPLLLIAAFVAVQVPFLGTAFRIDEPNIIRIGQRAEAVPADPYGFQINWVGRDESAFDVLANPPGVPLWLAATGSLFGWSEVSLHAAMLPFAALALLGMWILAGELGADRRLAIVLLAASPAFFLGSQVVMPDVAMLAFANLAVGLALLYRRTGSGTAAALSALCGLLAPFAKYNGVIAGAALGAVWLVSKERRKGLFALAAMPALGLAAWSLWSLEIYGRAHVLHMAEFESGGDTNIFSALVAYAGLALLPLAAALPSPPRPALRGIVEAVTAGAFGLMWCGGTFILELGPWASAGYGASAAIAIRYAVTACVLGSDWVRGRDLDGIALLCWLAFGIWFQFGLLFASARYLLPLLPPLILMVLRARLVDPESRVVKAALVASGALCVAIAIGDARQANLARQFVRDVVVPERAKASGRFFFDGHWGFQYYCEEAGGTILNYWKQERWREGDFVAIAMNPFPSHTRPQPGSGIAFESRSWELSPGWPVRTVDCAVPANFYGPGMQRCRGTVLPWGFATGPSDEFEIFRAVRAERGSGGGP
jgi:hypothetical protein